MSEGGAVCRGVLMGGMRGVCGGTYARGRASCREVRGRENFLVCIYVSKEEVAY